MELKNPSINRAVAAGSTMSGCLICLSAFSQDNTLSKNPNIPEILTELFQLLCKCMKWSPPSKYQFDFHTEGFPFCKECRSSIVRLYKFAQTLSKLQKQIDQVSLTLTATILESRNKYRENTGLDIRLDSTSKNCEPKKTDGLRTSEKLSYYRDTIFRRYCSSVRIVCERTLFSKYGEKSASGNISTRGTVPVHIHDFPSTNFEINAYNKGSNTTVKQLEENLQEKLQGNACDIPSHSGNEEFITSKGENLSHGYGFDRSLEISESGKRSAIKRNSGVTTETGVSEKLSLRNSRRKNFPENVSWESDPDRHTESSEESQDDGSDYEPSLALPSEQSEVDDHLDEESESDEVSKFLPIEIKPSGVENYCGPAKLRIPVIRTESYLRLEKHGNIQNKMPEDHNDVKDKDVAPEKEPFPSLRGRLKKVGDFLFLLDDKCLFEFTGKRFKCISCDISYENKYCLKKHFHSCPGNASEDVVESYRYRKRVYDKLQTGEFRCRLCQHSCTSYPAMICHMKQVHKGRRHFNKYRANCKPWYVELEPNKYLCNEKYPFELKGSNFECHTCLTNFPTPSKVLSHIHRVHIVPELRIKVSYKNHSPNLFVWTNPLNKTFSFEKVGNQYNCGQCTYITSRVRGIKEHIRYKHIEMTSVSSVCETCGKQFPAKRGLREHMKTHNNVASCVCEVCGGAFKTTGTLAMHRNNMHAEKCVEKFKCNVCGRFFGSKSLLRIHAGTHEVMVCDVCGKEVTRSALPGHGLSHNENSFKCLRCGKKYRYGFSLRVHMKSCGRGEVDKPFSCDICGMKFTQSYSVTRHKNVVHNTKVPRKRCIQSVKRKREETCSDTDESETREDT